MIDKKRWECRMRLLHQVDDQFRVIWIESYIQIDITVTKRQRGETRSGV